MTTALNPVEKEMLDLIGDRLAHVTDRRNVASIQERGLWPAAVLAKRAEISPAELALRTDRLDIDCGAFTVRLGHQRPIAHHIDAARQALDGYTPRDWAMRLDQYVFLWPVGRGERFTENLAHDAPVATLWFDTATLLFAHEPRLMLSPINSGNFARGGARVRRGDWLYVPAVAGPQAFRHNRVKRGLVRRPDHVAEISLSFGLSPGLLRAALQEIT